MSEARVVLDKSRPFSTCHGDRTPEDPHYRVAYWQGQLVGKDMVLLPFDAQGDLVADDGKTQPWKGLNVDSKECMYYPLYNPKMRDLLDKKKKRADRLSAKAEEEEKEEVIDWDTVKITEEVNFAEFLRGKSNYDWPILQRAARERFHRQFTSKKQLIVDLVLDEQIIPEHQLAQQYLVFLKPQDEKLDKIAEEAANP